MKCSVSIFMPAYNEEKNLSGTVQRVVREIKPLVSDYEILIINDGSKDKTLEIAYQIAGENKKIRVINHKVNKGFGYSFKEAIRKSKKKYITQFHADGDSSTSFLKILFTKYFSVDFISTAPKNRNVRAKLRIILSQSFIVMMNVVFRLNLKYFTGAFFCETKLLKQLHLESKGGAIYAEAQVRLIKRGYSYVVIPFKQLPRRMTETKNVNLVSVFHTLETIWYLFRDIYIQHRP